MLLARLTLACAAGSHALAAQRLGPGISLPRDFAVYPRAALLDAFVAVSLLGLTCIGAVQTPSRFATAHPPSTKEF